MALKTKSFQNYQQVMNEKNLNFCLITEKEQVKRLIKIINKVDSIFLHPSDQSISLESYGEKLIDNAITIIVSDESGDVGLISFYANDFESKTAFCSSLGIISSHRGGDIANDLIRFSLDYIHEVGLEVGKAEVSKHNLGIVRLLRKFHFYIESETPHNSYILATKLGEHKLPYYRDYYGIKEKVYF